jgi:hypothetical protein
MALLAPYGRASLVRATSVDLETRLSGGRARRLEEVALVACHTVDAARGSVAPPTLLCAEPRPLSIGIFFPRLFWSTYGDLSFSDCISWRA